MGDHVGWTDGVLLPSRKTGMERAAKALDDF